MIAPFAEAMGFDDLIATAYETKDGRYTGRLYEGFVWGTGKLRAVRDWADEHGVDLADCHACSDSIFDVPLLSSVGSPHAVNPDPSLTVVATARRWPVEHWDRPPGRPERRRARALPHAPPVRPQAVLSLRAVRHRRRRARATAWARAPGLQPPELLRRGGPGARGARHRAAGALPRQEGDLRRAGRRGHRPGHRRHPGRPGQRVGRAAAGGRVRAEGGGGGHRPAAGHHPAGLRLLRPGAARQDRAPRGWRRRPAPRWSPSGSGAPRTSGPARPGCPTSRWCATRPRSRSAWATRCRLSLTDAKADTHDHHGGHQRAAARRGAGAPRADRRGAGAHASPLGEGPARQRDHACRQCGVAPPRARPGHGGRRPGRAPARPQAARAPHVRAARSPW